MDKRDPKAELVLESGSLFGPSAYGIDWLVSSLIASNDSKTRGRMILYLPFSH